MSLPQARFPRTAATAAAPGPAMAAPPTPAKWQSMVKSAGTRLRVVSAVGFGLLAAGLVVVAGWAAVWGVQSLQPLGGSLALIMLGLGSVVGYEAWAVRPGSQSETVSEIANAAFILHRFIWVGIYLAVVLIVGLLTMHFTRLVQPDWAFLVATVLVFVNGALIAFWFEWLP